MTAGNIDVICFGELLWDMLPEGKVAGGAPFNIVNRATALGLNAYLISSVGNDELGAEILDIVQTLDNSIEYIQQHPHLPTSVVEVTVGDGGEPEYEIVHPVAWDDIRLNETLTDIVSNSRAFIYSSLALRDERSRKTLFDLLPHAALKVCDVNLREGNFSRSTIMKMIASADILRMNEDELTQVSDWLGIKELNRQQQIINLAEQFNYRMVIVTLGGDGAICYHQGKWSQQPVFKVEVKDTVGSGDAFLASFIYRYLHGDEAADCLKFACAVGALTASRSGGTPKITHEEISQLLSAGH